MEKISISLEFYILLFTGGGEIMGTLYTLEFLLNLLTNISCNLTGLRRSKEHICPHIANCKICHGGFKKANNKLNNKGSTFVQPVFLNSAFHLKMYRLSYLYRISSEFYSYL